MLAERCRLGGGGSSNIRLGTAPSVADSEAHRNTGFLRCRSQLAAGSGDDACDAVVRRSRCDVPLTWFAHQVPVVGMKLARRRWFDSVALCVGSMMPDLMYSFSAYLSIDPHRWPAAFVYGIPLGLIVAIALRQVVAPVLPEVLPDVGPFRLRSYGVLAERWPTPVFTVVSMVLGIGSHVAADWFTHPGRPGERWLGYDNLSVTAFGVTEPVAGVLQLIGHSVGSLGAIWLLWYIGSRRLLEEWYGEDRVDAVRARVGSPAQRIRFWALIVLGAVAGAVWGWNGELIEMIQRTAVGALLGCIIAAGLRPAPSTRT